MIGGGFLGGGISIVPAGKAIIYASMTTEDGENIPNAVFKAVRTGSTVTVNGSIDGRAELLVDAGHTYTVTVTPAGGSYLNRSQTVATASAKSYAVKFYLYPAKANEASTTASLNALNTSISTHTGRTDNPHAVTKAQVGLGSYPASPADIGISTATQTALNGLQAGVDNSVKKTGNEDIDGIKTFNREIRQKSHQEVGGTPGYTPRVIGRLHDVNDEILFDDTISKEMSRTGRHVSLANKDVNGDIFNFRHLEYVYEDRWYVEYIIAPDGTWRFYRHLNEDGTGFTGTPMRDAPGSSDAVNVEYVIDQVAGVVDYVDGEVGTHVARKDNPHAVTKAQVGLSNVDNTSDANKPISTAVQNALNAKADKTALNSGLALKADITFVNGAIQSAIQSSWGGVY